VREKALLPRIPRAGCRRPVSRTPLALDRGAGRPQRRA